MKIISRLTLSIALIVYLMIGEIAQVNANNNTEQPFQQEVMPNTIIVKFKTQPIITQEGKRLTIKQAPKINKAIQAYGIHQIKSTFPQTQKAQQFKQIDGLQRIYTLTYENNTSPHQVAAQLAQDKLVEYAEPKYIYSITAMDSIQSKKNRYTIDPFFGKAMSSTNQAFDLEDLTQEIIKRKDSANIRRVVERPIEFYTLGRDRKQLATPNDSLYPIMPQFNVINAPDAWDVVKGEQGDVVIAIVDGGTEWDHEDLADNIWQNTDEIAGNGIDDDNNGYIDDIRGWNFPFSSNDPRSLISNHGSHVAGIAGAVTNNGTGVSSLSWNCKIMPINAGSQDNPNSIPFGYEGITYAVLNGADIINTSWGGYIASQLGRDVVDFADANGVLLVAGAGNNSFNTDLMPFYPAGFPTVLSVGAIREHEDVRWFFSNYGVSTDVFAPGRDIMSTNRLNSYGISAGTSMASPMVAALAGLIKTRHPSWTHHKIREHIRVTCDDIDASNQGLEGLLGSGKINAGNALLENDLPSIRITNVAFTELTGNGDGIIDEGEVIQADVTLTNYLAATNNVLLTLFTNETELATVTTTNQTIMQLGTNQSTTLSFEFQVGQTVPSGTRIPFYVDMVNSTGYIDRDVFTITVTPPNTIDHNTGVLQMSVTNTGNIGWAYPSGFSSMPVGTGFVVDEENYLFEGGLMIGISPTQISDCLREGMGAALQQDFKSNDRTAVLSLITPGEKALQETNFVLNDSASTQPSGLMIRQQTFADTLASRQNLVIYQYEITNTNAFLMEDVYLGLYFDWDIVVDNTVNNDARYDAERKLGLAMDDADQPTKIAGVKVLSTNINAHYRSISNVADLFDEEGFSINDKWQFLSNGVQVTELNDMDISTLSAVGPIDLVPNQTATIGFALVGGTDRATVLAAADTAQALWNDEYPVGIHSVKPPYSLNWKAYPNPFNDQITIDYTVEQAAVVTITVYDIQGKQVLQTQQQQATGQHQYMVEMPTALSSNLYVVQLQIGANSSSQMLVRF